MVRISSNNQMVTPDRIALVAVCCGAYTHFLTWSVSFRNLAIYPLKTAPHAAAYKPNAAFFEALGPNLGATCLRKVIKSIPDDIPVLLDVKRGDIGSTAQAYAEACYEREEGLSADGVTLSPLMGWDSVQPFVTGE